MGMDLHTFLGKIKNYNPRLYISQTEGITIKYVKLLEENQTLFEPDHLYVCETFNFKKIPPQKGAINILCIKTDDLQYKPDKNSIVNLIVLNTNMDIFKTFNEIQSILIKYQEFSIASTKLLDALISGKGLEHIVNTGCEILKNPICILDLSFKLIASSKDIKVEDPVWIELLTKGYCSYNFVPKSNVRNFIDVVHKSTSPIFIGKDKFRIPRIISNIKINDKVVGYVTALECQKPFSRNDIEFIFLLCKVVASEMQKNTSLQNIKGLKYENFIMDLLNGKETDTRIIEERSKFLDLHFKPNLYVLVVNVPQNNFVNIPLHRVRDAIEYMLVGSKSVIYENSVVILISQKNKISDIEHSFSKVIDFFKKNNIHGGLSRCFHDLANTRKYYEQSLKAVTLGMGLKINKFLFYYEDLAIFHLLETCSSKSDLKNFCHDSIFSLMKYDKSHNTKYLKCLRFYLSNEKNQLKTSKALNICRSTLVHRIEKIQEIMGVNLNDVKITFHLNLSFIILEYIDEFK
jgi:sugar diacid utilization regulator